MILKAFYFFNTLTARIHTAVGEQGNSWSVHCAVIPLFATEIEISTRSPWGTPKTLPKHKHPEVSRVLGARGQVKPETRALGRS